MQTNADEWGLLSIADVLEVSATVADTGNAGQASPVEDLFFALSETRYTPAVFQFLHRLMDSLKQGNASFATRIEDTFRLRAQKVRQSLGASRRIREKLLAAVKTFQSAAPALSQTPSALSTITLLAAALGSNDAAYCEALLLGISQIDWKHASATSCREILDSFHLHSDKCTVEMQQRVMSAKLKLSLQSGTLGSLVECMLAPEARSLTLPSFTLPSLTLASWDGASSVGQFSVNATHLGRHLTCHCHVAAAATNDGRRTRLSCFPLLMATSSPIPSSASSADAALQNSGAGGTHCLVMACGGNLDLLEVAGLMGTRYRKLRSFTVPLAAGETVVGSTDSYLVTVQRVSRSDGRWRYCIQEIKIPSSAAAGGCSAQEAWQRGDRARAASSSELLHSRRRGFVVLCVEGLGVASGNCVFSRAPSTAPTTDLPSPSATWMGASATAAQPQLAVLLYSQSQNIAKRRLFVALADLEAVLASEGDTLLYFTKTSSTLLRDPAGSARQGTALHFTKGTSVGMGSVTIKERFHPFCIELWVYPRNVEETQTILSIGDKSVDEVLIELDPSSDGVVWRGGSRTPQLGSSFASYGLPGKLSTTERWWHVALNFSGTTWELWLDHRLVATQTALVSPEAIRHARCELGRNYVGFLAEVRVWDHVRSGAALMRDSFRSLTGREDGLLGYYPLNERHGTVLADYSAAGQHALVTSANVSTGAAAQQLNWCAIQAFPVASPDEPRFIPDFAPLSRAEDSEDVMFCVSLRYCSVAVSSTLAGTTSLHLYHYDRTTLVLRAQTTMELSGDASGGSELKLHGIAFNPAKLSTLCYGARKAKPDQEVLWDVHEPGGIDYAPMADRTYTSAWRCGRDVLIQCAAYAQHFIRSEVYLLDESVWSNPIPALVIDPSKNVISLLLRLGSEAAALGDSAAVDAACSLLRANLIFRNERNAHTVGADLGPLFPDAESLLSLLSASATVSSVWKLRDDLVRLAFLPAAEPSALLETLCQSFLSEQSRTTFVKVVAGHRRTPDEERLLACILEYYGTLRSSTELLRSPLVAQHLYTSLLLEATYLVERSTRRPSHLSLRRTSRCLEVFQEILFTQTSENAANMSTKDGHDQVNFCISYTKTLLKACERTIDAVVKAIRKHPASLSVLVQCLELSPVGALLPSFTVSLPFLPAIVLVSCAAPMQACRGALSGLMEVMDSADGGAGREGLASSSPVEGCVVQPNSQQRRWGSELVVSLTFSLCLVGCSLLEASSSFTVPPPSPDADTGDERASELAAAQLDDASLKKLMSVLRGGQRRAGTERDLLLRNLQQGVGAISKTFETLQRADPTGLIALRDEHLRRMERSVMAAFCALLLPTSALKEATKESLRPAFTHVQHLRPWVLSKRQESRECVQAIERKAAFLAQFECCCPTGPLERQQQQLQQQQQQQQQRQHYRSATDGGRAGKAGRGQAAGQQHRWRNMFRGWKRMRLLKTLLSTQEESDASRVASDIVELLQSNAGHAAMEQAVRSRTEKARYRLSGLLLLRQLVDETRVNPRLALITLPAIAKAMCGWHYADGVDCCSSEDMFHLQGAFFQLFDGVVDTYILEGNTHRDGVTRGGSAADGPSRGGGISGVAGSSPWRQYWAAVLVSMMTSVTRLSDFCKVRPEFFRGVRLMLGSSYGRCRFQRRLNGSLPPALREVRLVSGLAAPTVTLGGSGLTAKTSSGRGTCVAPCSWLRQRTRYTYYFELTIVDLGAGSSCCIGLGAMDYSLSRLPGWDAGSCALHSNDGAVFLGSTTAQPLGVSFGAGDVVGCGWQAGEERVYWTRNGKVVAEAEVAAAETLSPLIGLEGQTLVHVNFGRAPFLFNGSPGRPFHTGPLQGRARLSLAPVYAVWDAFRVFTTRAALGLAQACGTQNPASAETVRSLAHCAGCYLTVLGGEVRDGYAQLSARVAAARAECCGDDEVKAPVRDAMLYLDTVLHHCTTLAQLLSSVPHSVIGSRAGQLAGILQETMLLVLQEQQHQQQRAAHLPTAGENGGFFTNLLTAMYHVMHLVPPSSSVPAVAARVLPRAQDGEAAAATSSWVFLPLLLQLAGRLSTGARAPLATAAVGAATAATVGEAGARGCPPAPAAQAPLLRWPIMNVGGVSEEGTWMALSLLQRLNQSATGGAPSAGAELTPQHGGEGLDTEESALLLHSRRQRHAWSDTLHRWLVGAIARGGARANREVLLALSILGGGARLAAPGDVVMIRRSPLAITRATLIGFSFAEEICVVCGETNGTESKGTRHRKDDGDTGAEEEQEGCDTAGTGDQRRQTLPLRLVDLVIADDETSYFPEAAQHEGNHHVHQAMEVAALAKRVMDSATPSSPSSPDATRLYAQLFSILCRCVARGVMVDVPKSFLPVLSRLCDPVEIGQADTRRLCNEKVISEHCRVSTQICRASGVLSLPVVTRGGRCGVTVAAAGAEDGLPVTAGEPTSEDALLSTTSLSLDRGAFLDEGYDSMAANADGLSSPIMFLADPTAGTLHYDEGEDGLDSSDAEDNMDDVLRRQLLEDAGDFDAVEDEEDDSTNDSIDDDDDDDGNDYVDDAGADLDFDDGAGGGGGVRFVSGRRRTHRGHVHRGLADLGVSLGAYRASTLSLDNSNDAQALAVSQGCDTLRFHTGYLRVTSNRAIGLNFTLDLQLCLADIARTQVLFFHPLGLPAASVWSDAARTTTTDGVLALTAQVSNASVEFGVVDCARYFSNENVMDMDSDMCRFSLLPEDAGRWVRLSFVQSGSMLSLFRGGTLMDSRRARRGTGPMLREDLFFGGTPLDVAGRGLRGDMKGIRLYEIALRPAMIGQLHCLSSSLSIFVESHLCLQLRGRREGFDNYSRSPSALLVACAKEGTVTAVADPTTTTTTTRSRPSACASAPEVDFTTTADEVETFAMEASAAAGAGRSLCLLWKRMRECALDQVLTVYHRCWRGLLLLHSANLLVEILEQRSEQVVAWLAEDAHAAVATPPPVLSSPSSPSPPPSSPSTFVERLVQVTCSTSDGALSVRLRGTLCRLLRRALADAPSLSAPPQHRPGKDGGERARQENAAQALRVANDAARCLLQLAQGSEHCRQFESAEPLKPSPNRIVHEVSVPGRGYYEFFFAPFMSATNAVLAFATDPALSNVLTEAPGYALTPFAVNLRRVYFGITSSITTAQLGYVVFAVCDVLPQRRAVQTLRAMMSVVLEAESDAVVASLSRTARASSSSPSKLSQLPILWTQECLEQLGKCIRNNTGKTRRIALSCLSDLLLFPHLYPRPLRLPFMDALQELRHMADRRYRLRSRTEQPLTTVNARFTGAATEAYMMAKDAAQCLGTSLTPAAALFAPTPALPQLSAQEDPASSLWEPTTRTEAAEALERETFARLRQEQRMLYGQRESGVGSGERVTMHKAPDAVNLHLELTAERTYVARHEGPGGIHHHSSDGRRLAGSRTASLIALAALSAGKWYFEVSIKGAGDVYIGVLPSPRSETDAFGFPAVRGEPFAFNGRLGLVQDVEGTMHSLSDGHTWGNEDVVGVVINADTRRCHFHVNGQYTGIAFPFDVHDGSAAAAAAAAEGLTPEQRGEVDNCDADMLYYPFFALEAGEAVVVNFGSTDFEFEPPRGCLPLDMTHLKLGTLLPFNKMRAFQDLSAHVLTGGQHSLPPFYYEEADPFEGSTSRSGPAQVSLHAAEGVQINLLDVKNEGTQFHTVRADCGASAECWYYEVTLRTQGLMQIGWLTRRKRGGGEGTTVADDDDEMGGVSVGDSATSWSVDLFRRVKWHEGTSEAVAVQRRWAVGDVVGCALDLVHGEMMFFLNGRLILGTADGGGGAGTNPSSTRSSLNATFSGIPVGPSIEYVPAVSLRSGNQVTLNFGSSPFKYKPGGFAALGVPDSWAERVNTFYGQERLSVTMARMRTLSALYLQLGHGRKATGGGTTTTTTTTRATVAIDAALAPYQALVQAMNKFCRETGMNCAQLTPADLRKAVEASDSTAMRTAGAFHEWKAFKVLMAVARVAQDVVPFLNVNTQSAGAMMRLFLVMRTVLVEQQRFGLVTAMLKESVTRVEQIRIFINRLKAREQRRVFASSVFGQTFGLLATQSPRVFQFNKRLWRTVFIGEGAEDAGGPYREHFNEMCQELMSTDLPLFVPTANHAHNAGTHRDAFVPAAGAVSPLELSAYVFVGKLMGGAMRSDEPLSLFFPPLVWKFLCRVPLVEADLADVDQICFQCVQEFRQLREQPDSSQEAFDDTFDDLYFAVPLSDGTIRELIPNGARTRVTYDRCAEYAEALLQTRLHEFDLALEKIREGMLTVVPELVLLLFTPEELEAQVCGQADFSVEEIKKSAIFEGLTSEDRRVQFLWQALEEATPQQRRLFLRFVSGRDRMPVKLRILPLAAPSSQSQPNNNDGGTGSQQQQNEADLMLPRAATCFFALELPDYSTLAILKEKLYYSVENCASMDTDFNARATDENEGPQLMIGPESPRRPSDGDDGGTNDGSGNLSADG